MMIFVCPQAGLQVPPAPTGSARGHSRPGSAYSARSSASLSSRYELLKLFTQLVTFTVPLV